MTEKILPIPCTKVEEKTVKDWFQKINEELDEFKDTVMGCRWLPDEVKALNLYIDEKNKIVEEAADTITAITSMLEAMGIGEDMRQEAQIKVNAKNKARGRF